MGVLFRKLDSSIAREIYGDDIKAFDENPGWVRAGSAKPKTQKERVDAEQIAVLSAIKGVGDKTAGKLLNAGYDTVLSIIESTPEEIAKKTEVTAKEAEKIHAGAKAQNG